MDFSKMPEVYEKARDVNASFSLYYDNQDDTFSFLIESGSLTEPRVSPWCAFNDAAEYALEWLDALKRRQ